MKTREGPGLFAARLASDAALFINPAGWQGAYGSYQCRVFLAHRFGSQGDGGTHDTAICNMLGLDR